MSRTTKAMAAILRASLLAALLSACSHSSSENVNSTAASPANSPKTELAMGTESPLPSVEQQSAHDSGVDALIRPPLNSLSPTDEDTGELVSPVPSNTDAPKKNQPAKAYSETLSSSSSEASQPPANDEQAPQPIPERALDSKNPQLAGIRLGASKATVSQRLGTVRAEYDLPDGGTLIHMKDYTGVTVGFNDDGHAVYVELTDSSASSGLTGIGLGEGGQAAADALGLPLDPEDLLLLLDVSGGQYKIDLDPATRETLSVKLIGQP